jgi:BolA protein
MTANRVEQIEAQLQQRLHPCDIAVIDESHLHAGHAGARDGKGHFRVEIVSTRFEGLSPLARHRLVFAALQDLMATDIHALSIQAATPAENSPL